MHASRNPPAHRTVTTGDNYRLFVRTWTRGNPGADLAILYFHGIQSHGGWFERSADLLADGGLPVVLPDRRGSGRNRVDRGDAPSVERWLLDVDELAEWTAREFGVRRFALVGVSWGGKLAAAWALRRPAQIAGVLLVTPGLFPDVGVAPSTRIRIGACLALGGRRRFEIPLSDPALFTDNPAGRAFIANDDLKLTHATARFLYRSLRLDARLRRAPDRSLTAPTTLLLAERDRIIRNGPTREWLERIAARPPRVRELPCAHTLEFDESPGAFFEELSAWRDGLAAASGAA